MPYWVKTFSQDRAMTDQTLLGSYNHHLVVLSVLIAILSSYTALDLAGRVTASWGWPRLAWLISGATSMGAGIWSMHYIGMLAFGLPVQIQYDWPTSRCNEWTKCRL